MSEQSKKVEETELKMDPVTAEAKEAEAAETTEAEDDGALYAQNRGQSRKKKKIGKKEILMLVVPAVAAVIAVIVASVFVNRASIQKTESAGHQYYMGEETPIEAGSVIKKSEDGRTLAGTGDHVAEIPDFPIYFDDKDGFKITEDMILYAPAEGKRWKAEHFTDFIRESGSTIFAYYGGARQVVPGIFLFNGKNLYIFLEPVKLQVEGYTIDLSAFSYIEAINGDSIAVFDRDTKKMEVFGSDPSALVIHEDCSIKIMTDTMTVANGTRRMLHSNVDIQDPLFGTADNK